jgi:hypothetical protein
MSGVPATPINYAPVDGELDVCIMRGGTIIDATIIEAPSSTKNASRKGNTKDETTVEGKIHESKGKYGIKNVVFVGDRGMVTKGDDIIIVRRHFSR